MLAKLVVMQHYTSMSKNNLSPTIYGIETEYSCMITKKGGGVSEIVGSCHSVDAQLGLYIEPDSNGTSEIPDAGVNDALFAVGITRVPYTGMLSNGGRFYFDPSGPEYATPETTTSEEATHRSFDGDQIVLGVFESLRKADLIEGYQFNRRVVDHNRSSRGIHLNTSTNLSTGEISPGAAERIATLNVVKGSIFGSGGLLLDGEGQTQFHHSPRLSVTSELAVNYVNYKKRPLLRVPFKSDGALSRIETVTSDALNFAWPIRASLVATNALIQIIEMGLEKDLPNLRNLVGSAHEVGRFGNDCELEVIEGHNFIKRRPLDLMRRICEYILEVDSRESHLDDESDQVLGEIIEVADRMSEDMESAFGQVESVTRLMTMQKKMDKNGADLDSEMMCRFDYAWDLIGGGIAERLREKNLAGWQGFKQNHSISNAKKRKTKPPTDTRAFVRGNLIKAHNGTNNSTWEFIDFGNEDGASSYMHPLSTEEPTSGYPHLLNEN
jgi:hypothetical protein